MQRSEITVKDGSHWVNAQQRVLPLNKLLFKLNVGTKEFAKFKLETIKSKDKIQARVLRM